MSDLPALTLSASEVPIEPGSEASVGLHLQSRSTVVDEFELEVLGPAAQWTVLDPPSVSLFPGAEGQAQAHFRPPRSWTMSAGILTVGFRATSNVDARRSVVEECEVHVAPFTDVTMDMRPRTSRGRLRGRHKLQLRSESNTTVDIAIGAQELDGDCQLRVRPRQVRLRPGRSARAKLKVHPHYTPWFGPALENYTFEVGALPAGGQEVKMQGSMRQTALLPRGIVPLIVIAALIVGAIIIAPRLAPVLHIGTVGTVTRPTPLVPSQFTPYQPVVVPTQNGQATTAPTQPPSSPASTGPGGGGAVGSWAPVRAMAAARGQMTATTLNDGRVLVAGGFQVSGSSTVSLDSAETYDPRSAGWTTTGSMATGRAAHTATILQNGKVLVVGGENQAGAALATAELFDPSTNKWTPAGTLHTARFGHAAVRLSSNGKVLVAGGRTASGGSSTPLASTELYDPATNAWSAGPDLSVARSDLTATQLNDGRILVVGGDSSTSSTSSPQSTVDLVEPQGRSLVPGGVNMAAGRADHTATLLTDGRVLVVGGTLGTPRAELYSPATGQWSAAAAPSAGRRLHSAVLLPSGQVVVAGGADTAALASTEAYNPTTNTWSSGAAMSTPRWGSAMAELQNGQVLIVGGFPTFTRGTAPTATAEVYG